MKYTRKQHGTSTRTLSHYCGGRRPVAEPNWHLSAVCSSRPGWAWTLPTPWLLAIWSLTTYGGRDGVSSNVVAVHIA